jgi:hypothetical protein
LDKDNLLEITDKIVKLCEFDLSPHIRCITQDKNSTIEPPFHYLRKVMVLTRYTDYNVFPFSNTDPLPIGFFIGRSAYPYEGNERGRATKEIIKKLTSW